MKPHQIIKRPLLSEKGSRLKETGGQIGADEATLRSQVIFEVHQDANKIEIRRAVEHLFGSKVADVRTTTMRGKIKRQGRFAGRRPDWKKAYVRLREGEKLPEFLEGA